MQPDPLEPVRRAAWDGLQMALGNLMKALEWAVIALAVVVAAIGALS